MVASPKLILRAAPFFDLVDRTYRFDLAPGDQHGCISVEIHAVEDPAVVAQVISPAIN